jgi:sec-independent protein translocase protein TatB
MEILGIGPGEFVLILIVLLVVVGPERLPVLARQAGGFLVRARNWLQTSPDAALVMRARQEIEAELASIKNSLMEVQGVRDEVLDAAKQFENSVGSIAPPKFDMNSLVNPPTEPTIAANGQVVAGSEAPGLVLPDGTPVASPPLDQRSTLELPDSSNLPINAPTEAQTTRSLHNLPPSRTEPTAGASATPALGELESINIRLQAIMADLWALQQQLKQRGALDETWQPPSLDVQLPAQATIAPAAPASVVEPIEDPAVLAARKRLEELTPMRVAHHAPPVIQDAPADSAPEAASTTELDAPIEAATQLPTLVDPTAPVEQPVIKLRKRRAAASVEPIQSEIAALPTLVEPTAPVEPPVIKLRKRRAAASVEPIQAVAETPADGTPAANAHQRQTTATADPTATDAAETPADGTPAASAERSAETEPVTTEKAS